MNKIKAGQMVHALAQACARASHCFDNVPKLIVEIIKNELWKNFVVEESQKEVTYTKFEDFVTAKVPNGLETTMKMLENLCRDDPDALSSLTQVTKRPRGRPKKKEPEPVVEETTEDVICTPQEQVVEEEEKVTEKQDEETEKEVTPKPSLETKNVYNIHNKPRPSGTSANAAHRRLKKDRPDLHEQVIKKEKTVHQAMLEAEFRKPSFTISTEPVRAAKAISKRFSKDDIQELIDELQKYL